MADVMDPTGYPGDLGEGVEPPMFGLRQWLPDRRSFWDRSQEPWLKALAVFDRSEEWRVDGQLSCVDWIVWRMRVCRGTAFEWLRVGHELERRPVIAEALRSGEISYSAARAITRLDRPDPEVDEKLVELAKTGPVSSLEHAIRYYQVCKKQEELPNRLNRFDRRGVYLQRQFNGLDVANVVLDPVERTEFEAALEAFMESALGDDSSAVGDPSVSVAGDPEPVGDSSGDDDGSGASPDDGTAEPVDHSSGDDGPDPDGLTPWAQRRVDAFMDMVRTALTHIRDGHAVGADRYLVHAIIDTGAPGLGDNARSNEGLPVGQLMDGTLLESSVLERVCCDASVVAHFVDGTEPLSLGRKTRVWSSSQRRAIAVRDGSRCRFPGCFRRVGDIHHVQHWSRGGATDVSNGAYICTRHHTLLHKGFDAVGDASHQLTFYRPDGSTLGTSAAVNRLSSLLPV